MRVGSVAGAVRCGRRRARTAREAAGRLLRYDAEHQTGLVASLRAWLDAFGDMKTAAGAVHVHPSTFRYRLRRIAEVSGADLHDPEQRFAPMLQLRLLPDGPGTRAVSSPA